MRLSCPIDRAHFDRAVHEPDGAVAPPLRADSGAVEPAPSRAPVFEAGARR